MPDITATFKPKIQLEGTRIDVSAGGTRTKNYRTGVNHSPLISGTGVINLVDKANPLIFFGKVKVYIIPYEEYTDLPALAFASGLSDSKVASGQSHRGKPNAHIHITAPKVNRYAITYYSFGEKEPTRASAKLWRNNGHINVRYNKSGSGHIVIKAVTYYEGKKSEVAVAYFKIIRPNSNIVYNDITS